jgi:hypothetical protein
MQTIERCLNQISPPRGIPPGMSHAGKCSGCLYNPKENKLCSGYNPTTYELEKSISKLNPAELPIF